MFICVFIMNFEWTVKIECVQSDSQQMKLVNVGTRATIHLCMNKKNKQKNTLHKRPDHF